MAKKGLGKGLDALIAPDAAPTDAGGVVELRITEIEPNRNQPRKQFDEEALAALSESIREYGVLQPILVRRQENGFYQLLAGERRWRAARMAKCKTIPAVIRDLDDQASMEVALIENLQREDLNPMEEAMGYQELMDLFGLTQEALANKMGRSRPAIANALRLLNLSDGVKKLVADRKLSVGHARALLGVTDPAQQLALAKRILEEGLTVRQVERLLARPEKDKPASPQPSERERYLHMLETDLSGRFGTKVRIHGKQNAGKIEIAYYNQQELERVLEILKFTKNE